MSTIAMLAGGILGVFLRNLVDGPLTADATQRWRCGVLGVFGGLVLGVLTGAAVGAAAGQGGAGSPAADLVVGLSSVLLTYCVFSNAATALIKHGLSRATLWPAILRALTAFAAATGGVALGVLLTS